jgi:hypothetical protein
MELAEKVKLLHEIKSRYSNDPSQKDCVYKNIKTES